MLRAPMHASPQWHEPACASRYYGVSPATASLALPMLDDLHFPKRGCLPSYQDVSPPRAYPAILEEEETGLLSHLLLRAYRVPALPVALPLPYCEDLQPSVVERAHRGWRALRARIMRSAFVEYLLEVEEVRTVEVSSSVPNVLVVDSAHGLPCRQPL